VIILAQGTAPTAHRTFAGVVALGILLVGYLFNIVL